MNVKKPKQRPDTEYYADTLEQEEKEQKQLPLNREEGILVNKLADGLNTEQSIFDRTALFLTKQGEQT